jgi:hypothetical protein
MPKIADYPKTLPRQEQYTAGEVAILYGVSHRTACKMIDSGLIRGRTLPGSRERRVLLTEILAHARGNHGNFQYVLDKIEGLTPEEKTLLP